VEGEGATCIEDLLTLRRFKVQGSVFRGCFGRTHYAVRNRHSRSKVNMFFSKVDVGYVDDPNPHSGLRSKFLLDFQPFLVTLSVGTSLVFLRIASRRVVGSIV